MNALGVGNIGVSCWHFGSFYIMKSCYYTSIFVNYVFRLQYNLQYFLNEIIHSHGTWPSHVHCVGDVALWLGCRSVAGGLSLICA